MVLIRFRSSGMLHSV